MWAHKHKDESAAVANAHESFEHQDYHKVGPTGRRVHDQLRLTNPPRFASAPSPIDPASDERVERQRRERLREVPLAARRNFGGEKLLTSTQRHMHSAVHYDETSSTGSHRYSDTGRFFAVPMLRSLTPAAQRDVDERD